MTNKVMPTYYHQIPVSFEYGRGAWLWDTAGNQYLDALAGIAVCGLGHAHPAVTKTITEQAGKVMHVSNTYTIPQQIALAEKLTNVAEMDQAYFCNSGAEANETALKLTRLYARKKGIIEPIILTMRNSFHGRSLATLTASGSERLQIGFEPLVKEFQYVNLNDLAELKDITTRYQDRIIAIMLEPIQGDGGIRIASNEFLQEVRSLCDQHDWLLILDEVQTGMGRTGKWFAHHHTQIKPDIMTVAKALGNGIPIGACLASGKAANLFGPGKHGSTFGGNPLATAVGCTVIDTMEKENLVNHTATIGDHLLQQLTSTLKKYPQVINVRGKGLMLGIELDKPAMDVVAIGVKNKILFNIVSNSTIRLLPPIIITKEEADEIVARLDKTLEEYFSKS